MDKISAFASGLLFATVFWILGCNQNQVTSVKKLKVAMVLDTGGDTDRGFNEYSLKGARDTAKAADIEFVYMASESTGVYERNIDKVLGEGADLVFTVGFALANATAKAAIRYPSCVIIAIVL